jgi:hypothetical protein
MTDSVRPVIAVFARAPVLGRVKTRLAAAVGDALALDVHQRLLDRTLAVVGRVTGADCELWLDTACDSYNAVPQRLQPAGDLGTRMLAVIEDIARRGCAAIVLGSDCPVLDTDYLLRALERLAHHDVVLGPVEDGGYILIGMRAPHPELLLGMRWSHPRVAADTLARAQLAGLTVGVLEPLWDVDDAADLARWQALPAADRRPWRAGE